MKTCWERIFYCSSRWELIGNYKRRGRPGGDVRIGVLKSKPGTPDLNCGKVANLRARQFSEETWKSKISSILWWHLGFLEHFVRLGVNPHCSWPSCPLLWLLSSVLNTRWFLLSIPEVAESQQLYLADICDVLWGSNKTLNLYFYYFIHHSFPLAAVWFIL